MGRVQAGSRGNLPEGQENAACTEWAKAGQTLHPLISFIHFLPWMCGGFLCEEYEKNVGVRVFVCAREGGLSAEEGVETSLSQGVKQQICMRICRADRGAPHLFGNSLIMVWEEAVKRWSDGSNNRSRVRDWGRWLWRRLY